ncbi:unnamed protein product, partial [Vitis vinifera]
MLSNVKPKHASAAPRDDSLSLSLLFLFWPFLWFKTTNANPFKGHKVTILTAVGHHLRPSTFSPVHYSHLHERNIVNSSNQPTIVILWVLVDQGIKKKTSHPEAGKDR